MDKKIVTVVSKTDTCLYCEGSYLDYVIRIYGKTEEYSVGDKLEIHWDTKRVLRKADDMNTVAMSDDYYSSICPADDVCDATNPSHYNRRKIEPWDYVMANGLDYFEGNVVKYVTRWKEKGGVEDLKKAIKYLERMIKEYDKQNTAR